MRGTCFSPTTPSVRHSCIAIRACCPEPACSADLSTWNDAAEGVKALERLGPENRTRLIVEDPSRPLDASAEVSGTARIVTDMPEWVEVKTDSSGPAYLVLADTFDPGWSATVDGSPAPIRPAYVAFRAVALTPGSHTVAFTYRPAGFTLGLAISIVGIALAIPFWLRGGRLVLRSEITSTSPVARVPQAALPDVWP